MIRTRQCTCRRCSAPFTQPCLGGQPLEYCGVRCRLEAKRERRTQLARDRYRALRGAGVPHRLAQPGSVTKSKYEALMQEYA